MTPLGERIVEIRQQTTPASMLAKACDYALGQWERMKGYLGDGRIEIDNNWCEGAMRPVALGRKNWLRVGHETAGPKLAAIMSIVETAADWTSPCANTWATSSPASANGPSPASPNSPPLPGKHANTPP